MFPDGVLLFEAQSGFALTAAEGGEGSCSAGYVHVFCREEYGRPGQQTVRNISIFRFIVFTSVIIYAFKDTAKHKFYGDRKQTTIWEFDKPVKSKLHPTMKSLPLIAYPMRISSQENSINSAFIIESPSKRMKPAGEYVAAGIGEGMAGYDFTTDPTSMVTALQTAMSATLPGTLKIVCVNAMAGLKEGINSGRFSVISAMLSAVQAAVTAAKQALKIASPPLRFSGMRSAP